MKRVGRSLYVHRTAMDDLPDAVREAVWDFEGTDWSVMRVDMERGRPAAVMFGWTTSWEDDPHPKLLRSVLYRKGRGGEWFVASERTYLDRPVYHRKETMLPADHPRHAEYAALTAQEDAAGLLGRRDIGRESQWSELLSCAGYELVGHTLRRAHE
jgi:hypothetical protein